MLKGLGMNRVVTDEDGDANTLISPNMFSTSHGANTTDKFDFVDNTHNCREVWIANDMSDQFYDERVRPSVERDPSHVTSMLYGSEKAFKNARLTCFCIESYMTEIQRKIRWLSNYKYIDFHWATAEEYLHDLETDLKSTDTKFEYVPSSHKGLQLHNSQFRERSIELGLEGKEKEQTMLSSLFLRNWSMKLTEEETD